MEGIILAGGLGTRLRPRVRDLPKPLAPIAGRPFLCWLLDRLAQTGFRRIILSVGYRGAAIMAALGSRHSNIELVYAIEDQPLGTGGAIRHAMALLDAGSHAVWVMNGDTMCGVCYQKMFVAHATATAPITMAVVRVADASRYGTVVMRDNCVIGFDPAGMSGSGLINSGTYLLNSDLFADAEWPAVFSLERDVLPSAIDRVGIRCFETDGWFIDIGVPEDFDRAQMELPNEFARLTR
jgi:D-glycero-alpha-D-manno-heptose 1-phosphate guanylyltransferase